MTVQNDLDRFHLVQDVVDRAAATGLQGRLPEAVVQDKLIEHKQYIDQDGQDMPEIRNWRWDAHDGPQTAERHEPGAAGGLPRAPRRDRVDADRPAEHAPPDLGRSPPPTGARSGCGTRAQHSRRAPPPLHRRRQIGSAASRMSA